MKTATAPLPPLRSVKVLDQLRERIRYLHYSLPTEQAYVHWVRAFIRFHGGHCCKVSDEAAFCLIQRPYISKTLLTRRISPRGSP
ncbi:phage integrase N-terminal SAM-like domain-containing protein [Shigella flexneri]